MLAGEIADFSIEDVLGLLALTRKTGALRVEVASTGSVGEARVHFREGSVCLATADSGRLSIASRLVADGHLTTDRLRALAACAPEHGPLAFVRQLLADGDVEAEVLDRYVAEETNDAVAALLRLEAGGFTFDTDVAAPTWSRPTHEVAQLLGEGHRRAQMWEAIEESLPELDAVLSVHPVLADGRDEVTLTRHQWQALSMVDGRRSARAVAELLGTGELAACRTLSELVAAGLLEIRREGTRSALDEVVEARSALAMLERRGAPTAVASAVSPDAPPAAREQPASGGQTTPPTEDGPTPTEHGTAPRQVVTPPPAAQPAAPSATELAGTHEPGVDTNREAEASDDRDEDDDDPPNRDEQPPASRADVRVDRAQMARELASLGMHDAPAGRGPTRAVATDTDTHAGTGEHVGAVAQPEQDPGQPETMVEHRLVRDTELSRGLLLRLIDGVKGA